MIYRSFFVVFIVIFAAFCGALVIESGLFDNDTGCTPGPCITLQNPASHVSPTTSPLEQSPENSTNEANIELEAVGAKPRQIILGAKDPNTENPQTGFRFQLLLNTKGASIKKATFSNGQEKGFDDRDPDNPKPLKILTPIEMPDGTQILSLASGNLLFDRHGLLLALDKLHWKTLPIVQLGDGGQKVSFEADIKNRATGRTLIKIIKDYSITPGSYMLKCSVTIENISEENEKVRFTMNGPLGLPREGVRSDMRKAVAAFRKYQTEEIISTRLELKKFDQELKTQSKLIYPDEEKEGKAGFLWTAAIDKYFAGILVPMPQKEKEYCDWIDKKFARFYNPDSRKNTKDENIGVSITTTSAELKPAGQPESTKKFDFRIYIGPKDKRLFDANKTYTKLGFAHTIDFLACCCPASIISPLAFGILAIMEWLYSLIGNYGLAIIILVFVFRLAIHPLTRKSQVSMSKFGTLAPKMEEIKKKYANNKTEMNKQLMALYKEQGASPIMGMLPMFVQMPVWISLYSAIYASVALRGEPFLPVWITDLSAPDALFRFPAVNLPLFGELDAFNLLPILMGIAFYLQQKLMPRQQAQTANPQMAQQQKMMMIMLPLMFPLLLYKAPSGLNLYIMASTFAGVIEQYFIRKHIREKQQQEAQGLVAATSKTGGKAKKNKPKPFYKNM